MRSILAAAVALLAVVLAVAPAAALRLEPYKDELFAYPGILEQQFGGDWLRVDYNRKRDLQDRDAEDERKVHGEYVSIVGGERTLTLKVGDVSVKYIAVGRTEGARLVVIYLHGMNGSRFQGVDDWMFGGNFNRIKNLMVRNDGLYISPDFTDFTQRGKVEITALMEAVAAKNPGAPIFVACGSYGGVLCWNLAGDPQSARLLGGLMFLGSISDEAFPAVAGNWEPSSWLPIYIGHGSADAVFDWRDQDAFFRRLKGFSPSYPVRFTLFETGSHGTPIRMTDWRLVLNWMLAASGR